MNKRDFVIQYALYRAGACPGQLEGSSAVQEALTAWAKIEEGCPITPNLETEIKNAVALGFERDYTEDEMIELIMTILSPLYVENLI
jgi:hypothetical protein